MFKIKREMNFHIKKPEYFIKNSELQVLKLNFNHPLSILNDNKKIKICKDYKKMI